MSIYEYDEERELKLIRADERELGREEERKNTEEALEKVEAERREKEEAIVSMCREFGCTKEEAVKKLMDKCRLNIEVAEDKVNRYWE